MVRRSRKRNKPTPNMRNIPELLEAYKPLVFSIYGKRNYEFRPEDKQDFKAQLFFIFTNLVFEYDPDRKVDFPFYIKRMMEFRTEHYITTYRKNRSRGVVWDPDIVSYAKDSQSEELWGPEMMDEEMLEVLHLESWDDKGLRLSSEHRRIFRGVLTHNKNLRQLAEEEGESLPEMKRRLEALILEIHHHRQKGEETG